jgi:hypothetical protein
MGTNITVEDGKHIIIQEGTRKKVRTYNNGAQHGQCGNYSVVKTIKYSDTIIEDGIEVIHSEPAIGIVAKFRYGCFFNHGKLHGQEVKYPCFNPKVAVEKLRSVNNTKLQEASPNINSAKEIFQRVIALKYRYLHLANEHDGITLENRDRIAAEHNWGRKNSGRKIYNYYNEYLFEPNRTMPNMTSDEPNYFQAKNRILKYLRQAILELKFSPKAQEIANKELAKIDK